MKAAITPEVAAAAYDLDDFSWIVEEELWCGTCGEDFAVGQQAIEVRAPEQDVGRARAVETIHLRCYQGEEVPA